MVAKLIPLLIQISIVGIVFSLGLRVSLSDMTWVLRRPRALLQSALAMFVVMPLVAAAMGKVLDLPPVVKLILVAVALSPVPPILPKKELGAGARMQQTIGLMVAASLLAIVLVPFGAKLIASWFGLVIEVDPIPVVRIVAISVVIPLIAGLLFRTLAPTLGQRFADPVGKISLLLLVLGALPVLVLKAGEMWTLVGDGTLLAFAAFVAIGLAVGHALGGSDPKNRTVLALSTASRHPGLAVAIAAATAPDIDRQLAAVLLYLLVGALVTGVYLALRRRSDERAE